jgi:hypothetical protein
MLAVDTLAVKHYVKHTATAADQFGFDASR